MMHARNELRSAAVVLVTAAAMLAEPAAARRPTLGSASAAPAWAREAAATAVPGDLSGLDGVTLLDEWQVRPRVPAGVSVTHRRVVRVLRPEGLGPASEWGETYGQDDRIERFEAWNLLPDGRLRQPDPDDDVVDLPYTASGTTVDDVRLRALTVPGVVVGSVVATETVVVDAIDRGALGVTFGDTDGPVGACRLAVEVPAGWTFGGHGERAEAFTRHEAPSGLSWSAASLPRPPAEDWAPPPVERLPRLFVSWRSPDGTRGFADWDAVAAWHRNLAEPPARDVGEALTLSRRLQPADASRAEEALRAAFAFASRDVRYVAIEMGIGGYRPQSPAFTCANRYGDCKAKAFLLRSLVEPWGWKVYPVIVRTRDRGALIPAVPTPGQFNHVIAAVALPEGVGIGAWNVRTIEGIGRLAFVDPTTTHLGPWQLRDDDQGTTALLVLPTSGRLVELPVQPADASVSEIHLEAAVDERGHVTSGTIRERYTGTRAGSIRGSYARLSSARLRDAALRSLQDWVPGATLTEHSVEGVATLDADIVEVTRFSGGRLGQRAGEMLIVRPPGLALPVPALRLGPPPRATRVDLGLPERRLVEVAITTPPGWVPEALPTSMSHDMRQFTLESTWERTASGFTIRGDGSQLVTSVEPGDYAVFRDAARAAASGEAVAIVLVPAPPAE